MSMIFYSFKADFSAGQEVPQKIISAFCTNNFVNSAQLKICDPNKLFGRLKIFQGHGHGARVDIRTALYSRLPMLSTLYSMVAMLRSLYSGLLMLSIMPYI